MNIHKGHVGLNADGTCFQWLSRLLCNFYAFSAILHSRHYSALILNLIFVMQISMESFFTRIYNSLPNNTLCTVGEGYFALAVKLNLWQLKCILQSNLFSDSSNILHLHIMQRSCYIRNIFLDELKHLCIMWRLEHMFTCYYYHIIFKSGSTSTNTVWK